jgi:hypothetical protein
MARRCSQGPLSYCLCLTRVQTRLLLSVCCRRCAALEAVTLLDKLDFLWHFYVAWAARCFLRVSKTWKLSSRPLALPVRDTQVLCECQAGKAKQRRRAGGHFTVSFSDHIRIKQAKGSFLYIVRACDLEKNERRRTVKHLGYTLPGDTKGEFVSNTTKCCTVAWWAGVARHTVTVAGASTAVA